MTDVSVGSICGGKGEIDMCCCRILWRWMWDAVVGLLAVWMGGVVDAAMGAGDGGWKGKRVGDLRNRRAERESGRDGYLERPASQ